MLHDPSRTAEDSMSSITITTTEGFFLRDGLTALTTVFTPPASLGCETRWIYDCFDFPCSQGSKTVVSNYSPEASAQNSILLGYTYFEACLPFQLSKTAYNPGICPSGQMIQKITESRLGSSRLWEAHCCPRCVGKEYPDTTLTLTENL